MAPEAPNLLHVSGLTSLLPNLFRNFAPGWYTIIPDASYVLDLTVLVYLCCSYVVELCFKAILSVCLVINTQALMNPDSGGEL